MLFVCDALTRDHTLSSDLPLMRFFFISPQQKISSLHTGNETDSEFEVFSKRMILFVFPYTRVVHHAS